MTPVLRVTDTLNIHISALHVVGETWRSSGQGRGFWILQCLEGGRAGKFSPAASWLLCSLQASRQALVLPCLHYCPAC